MGITITGVRTTGIYCRDGCPAKPLPRNMRTFRSAVAAEAAGYRPCLRCRPDQLPPFVHEDGTGLVGRALALIAEGALDVGTEESLARRLGVSARHLRRLFHERVGATPALVGRARRAHFARRLLDETDLPIADIAFAAGFSSVRQMNRVIAAVFRFTPRELRARRRDADRLGADGGLPLRIAYAGALDVDAMLGWRSARAIPGVESVEGHVYRRTISACGHPGVIELSPLNDGKHLLAVVHLPALGTLIDDVERCRRLFGLDRTPAGATSLAHDPLLGDAAQAHSGLRVPGAWDPFETAVRIMLGGQEPADTASATAARLVHALGTPVPGLGAIGLTHLFPPAAHIAEASLERLRCAGLSAGRAQSIRALARAYADERVHLDAGAQLEELTAALTSLPGVDTWAAQMIALHAAGQPDAFPAQDPLLRREATRLMGRPWPLDTHELLEMAEAWRPHRALAAMLLWTYGSNSPATAGPAGGRRAAPPAQTSPACG